MMNSADDWRNLFESWPESIPRQGLVVTMQGETIPFVSYMVSGGILLLERDKPDSHDARKVMLVYDAIASVKITSPMEMARFQVMGFQAPM